MRSKENGKNIKQWIMLKNLKRSSLKKNSVSFLE